MKNKKETEAYFFAKETITFVLRDFLKQCKKEKLNLSKQNFLKKLKEHFKDETESLMWLSEKLEIPGHKILGKDIDEFLNGFGEHCFYDLDVSLKTLNDLCKEYDKINQEEHPKKEEIKQTPSASLNNNVKIGQIWESMDKSRPKRKCVVTGFKDDKAILQEVNEAGDDTGKRPTSVTISNMKPNSKGWILYQDI